MDARLTLDLIPAPSRSLPSWRVMFEGRRIGRIVQKRIGRAANFFYEAFVLIDGDEVSLEVSIDRDERCDRILAAHLDPLSNVHSRDWVEHRDRVAAFRARRSE